MSSHGKRHRSLCKARGKVRSLLAKGKRTILGRRRNGRQSLGIGSVDYQEVGVAVRGRKERDLLFLSAGGPEKNQELESWAAHEERASRRREGKARSATRTERELKPRTAAGLQAPAYGERGRADYHHAPQRKAKRLRHTMEYLSRCIQEGREDADYTQRGGKKEK